jgi:hypothetical protein
MSGFMVKEKHPIGISGTQEIRKSANPRRDDAEARKPGIGLFASWLLN